MKPPYYETMTGCPPQPCWIINHDVDRALHNLRFMRGLDGNAVRVYLSTDCSAIVISNQPLERIREPHVMAWRDSFYEISQEDFVIRAAEMANGSRNSIGDDHAVIPRAS